MKNRCGGQIAGKSVICVWKRTNEFEHHVAVQNGLDPLRALWEKQQFFNLNRSTNMIASK
jgi:hypothetical protein